jgi:hypothetical protein
MDPQHVEQTFNLLERGPIRFVAAFFVVAFVALLLAFIRSLQMRVRDARVHTRQIQALLTAERERTAEREAAQLERAMKLEHVAAGFLRLVNTGVIAVRAGKPKLRVADATAADAPTVSTRRPRLGSDDDDDNGADG